MSGFVRGSRGRREEERRERRERRKKRERERSIHGVSSARPLPLKSAPRIALSA